MSQRRLCRCRSFAVLRKEAASRRLCRCRCAGPAGPAGPGGTAQRLDPAESRRRRRRSRPGNTRQGLEDRDPRAAASGEALRATGHGRRARQRIKAQPSGGAGRGEQGTRPLRRIGGAG